MADEILIAPSILAADYLRLGDEVRGVQAGGADRIQIDVMDGRFVPNITFGPGIVQAVRSATSLFLEAHLMIVEPERYVQDFAEAGADMIIVHTEPSPHIYRTVQEIRRLGKRAGVALNPGTPPLMVHEVLHLLDMVLVMTVNPGFGGQEFIEAMLPKIRAIRDEIARRKLAVRIEVDGGINDDTAPLVTAAGATVLVAGTAVYRDPAGPGAAISRLRQAAQCGLQREDK